MTRSEVQWHSINRQLREVKKENVALAKRMSQLDSLLDAARVHTLDHEQCGCGLCMALRRLSIWRKP